MAGFEIVSTNRPFPGPKAGLTEAPEIPRIDVRRGEGLFGKSNAQDIEDQNRAWHIQRLALLGGLADRGLAYVAITGYEATVGVSQHLEDSLARYPMESRTHEVALALFDPMVQGMAQSALATEQVTARAMLNTLSR